MDKFDKSKSDTWRSTADRSKRKYVSYALSGLRARHYAGVFHKTERAKHPTFQAEIKLDGFERSLVVKFTLAPPNDRQLNASGTLRGLPLSKASRCFDLTRNSEGPYVLLGNIDLPGACLAIGILPARSSDGSEIYICHVEVVRDDAQT